MPAPSYERFHGGMISILGDDPVGMFIYPGPYLWVQYFTGNDDDSNQALNQAIDHIANFADNFDDWAGLANNVDQIVEKRLALGEMEGSLGRYLTEYESIGGGLEARMLGERDILRTVSLEARIARLAEKSAMRGAEERLLGRDIIRTVERRASVWRRIGRAARFLW